MNTEAIKAAQTLLESKIIDQEQFAKLVITALNGHAAAATQLQLSMAPKARKHTHYLTIDQMDSIVQMTVAGHAWQTIADTVNNRYGLRLTKAGVSSIVRDIANGKKQQASRYQSNEWREAFATWQKALRK